ncbi:MAG: dihydrofolate synthase [Flavobacteriales bacterium]|nr:MAG: dihydrofolate synthase [Flavobacteriales bacterium]
MPRFTSYSETLDYMFSQLPMFHNIGKAAYKADLNNTIALLEAIGNPHIDQKWIHVAGTNGKGSVSSMLAATLTQHGYKTGLYTSPHLLNFTERIRIDGKCIDEKTVIDFMNEIHETLDRIKPSFFEITVALAFYHFRAEKIDIGVIEVGLGGRLDSTNVITPILSVITNIGWDHMDLLGNSIDKIAAEKAGIIKRGVPVALGPMRNEAMDVMKAVSIENNAKIYHDLAVDVGFIRRLALKGNYQLENIQTFAYAIEALKDLWIPLKRSLIMEALENVVSLTGLRGRWEVISNNPWTVTDIAHNSDGINYTMGQLRDQYAKAVEVWKLNLIENHNSAIEINAQPPIIRMVWGMVSDKDRKEILSLLPKDAIYYFCKPSVIRGLDADELATEGHEIGLAGMAFDDVQTAYFMALKDARPQDLIYVGGSTFVVADLLLNLQ